MRTRPLTLLVSVALLGSVLAGCGGDDQPDAAPSETPSSNLSSTPTSSTSPTATPTPSPSLPPITLKRARTLWDGALDRIVEADTGRYTWTVTVGNDEFVTERGVFGVDPLRSSLERLVENKSGTGPDVLATRLRRFSDRNYLQMADWGRWDGCWLPFTDQQAGSKAGLDYSDSIPLPVAVVAILGATVTRPTGDWFGAPYRDLTGKIDGITALQFFAVSPRILVEHQDELRRARIPIDVSLDRRGRLHGAGLSGLDVNRALRARHVDLDAKVALSLDLFKAEMTFVDFGRPVEVERPPARLLLPEDAGRKQTCPARDGVAS